MGETEEMLVNVVSLYRIIVECTKEINVKGSTDKKRKKTEKINIKCISLIFCILSIIIFISKHVMENICIDFI